ncbi:hypothetical protein [Dechloromonas sp. HYN0024]|uniref:hypothetical protein n=1 Tax=Dechloromonas sp. HYN0024 TaxID=2231055 RepID=UPI000E443B8A|nr:hypothetical protein [Dechloromonas sp. HYN0024]AXS80511.1 hypothetical protein HYN24_11050 [Dechloromonas sp. HYN0024]
MFFLRYTFAATLVAAFFDAAHAAEPADRQFAAIAALSPSGISATVGQMVEVDIDLAAGGGLVVEPNGERIDLLYRMAFNQIAEGWSWRPLADPALDDYYQYKFLPLQSVLVERGEYAAEDKIGTPQQMKVSWRYDYFLAFDNLYDFYPRTSDDDAGFSASLLADVAGRLGMRATARLIEPVISESTTFWKAIYGKPTDFTLKKRYFLSRLESVDFVDTVSGEVLCRIRPGQGGCAGR